MSSVSRIKGFFFLSSKFLLYKPAITISYSTRPHCIFTAYPSPPSGKHSQGHYWCLLKISRRAGAEGNPLSRTAPKTEGTSQFPLWSTVRVQLNIETSLDAPVTNTRYYFNCGHLLQSVLRRPTDSLLPQGRNNQG